MTIDEEFTTFWARFPRKVGKLAAKKAYLKARKTETAETLLGGIGRYLAAKADYADICHPSTFLTQGRYLDEPDAAVSKGGIQFECPHMPACLSRWACGTRQRQERQAS